MSDEVTNIEINHALACATWLVLRERAREAWESDDTNLALLLGEIMAEIREEAKGMLQDETHPAWELDYGR